MARWDKPELKDPPAKEVSFSPSTKNANKMSRSEQKTANKMQTEKIKSLMIREDRYGSWSSLLAKVRVLHPAEKTWTGLIFRSLVEYLKLRDQVSELRRINYELQKQVR